MVEMGILMEGEAADIVPNLNAAETVYIALDSPRIVWCSALAAKINLLRGDMETARVAFLECLSKNRSIFPDIHWKGGRRWTYTASDPSAWLELERSCYGAATLSRRRGCGGLRTPLFVRSSHGKDAASIEKRLEKLSQQDNSYRLLAIREGAVDEATDSALVVLKLSDGETAAVETSLEKLGNVSAPNTSPSLQLEGVRTEDDIETCF
ncbi:hypothetical protein B0H13DRAFT_1861941 [Mycena leptocephala]|nr:hypothetical protein B0H13DRAFT_1861941 [Mycena leptocephala]